MQDVVYFNCACAPGDKDWLRCEVQSKRDGVLRVHTQVGFSQQTMEFPLSNVQRIEYGTQQR